METAVSPIPMISFLLHINIIELGCQSLLPDDLAFLSLLPVAGDQMQMRPRMRSETPPECDARGAPVCL